MPQFQYALIPCTASPVIRDMFRQVKSLSAVSLKDAKAILAEAFPDGMDLTGEWLVEHNSIRQVAQ